MISDLLRGFVWFQSAEPNDVWWSLLKIQCTLCYGVNYGARSPHGKGARKIFPLHWRRHLFGSGAYASNSMTNSHGEGGGVVVMLSDLGSKDPGFDPHVVPKMNACLKIFTTIKLCLMLYYVFDSCFAL